MKTTKILNWFSSSIINNVLILLISIFLLSASSCKSKKKVTDIVDDEIEVVNPNIMESKTTIKNLLEDDTMSIEDKEKILADIKKLNIDDAELNDLIAQLEDKIAKEKDEIERKKEAAKPENMLASYFNKIIKAPSEDNANKHIEDALTMFSSAKSTVLIIIAQDGHTKDYDKPTNITKYLNYLKDTKNNTNSINEIKWDANKKIKTLILKKN